MKILIPINKRDGFDSIISEHFGHCSEFAIYDSKTRNLSFVSNTLDHSEQTPSPADQVTSWGIDMIITRGMGPKAQALFKTRQIPVHVTSVQAIGDAIEQHSSKRA